jgi:hypothetical protein
VVIALRRFAKRVSCWLAGEPYLPPPPRVPAEFAWRADAGQTAQAVVDEAHEFRHGLEAHWFEAEAADLSPAEVDALFAQGEIGEAVREVMLYETLAMNPEAQWRLRRESLGLLETLALTEEQVADQRIAAAREKRIAREGK